MIRKGQIKRAIAQYHCEKQLCFPCHKPFGLSGQPTTTLRSHLALVKDPCLLLMDLGGGGHVLVEPAFNELRASSFALSSQRAKMLAESKDNAFAEQLSEG